MAEEEDENEGPVEASLDDEDEDEEGAEGEEGGSKKKMLIFIVAGVLLLGGAGAGLFFTGMLDGLLGKDVVEEEYSDEEGHEEQDDHGDESDDHGEDHGDSGKADKGDDHAKGGGKKGGKDGHGKDGEGDKPRYSGKGPAFLKMPDMIVNLNSPDGDTRFLRLAVQLELKNGKDLQAVEQIMPRIVDQFQTYLRELRVKDLRGSAGIYRLQIELLSRVNQVAHPVEVKDVLFQEILIQ